jgi:uncharacterized protein YxeA
MHDREVGWSKMNWSEDVCVAETLLTWIMTVIITLIIIIIIIIQFLIISVLHNSHTASYRHNTTYNKEQKLQTQQNNNKQMTNYITTLNKSWYAEGYYALFRANINKHWPGSDIILDSYYTWNTVTHKRTKPMAILNSCSHIPLL